MREHCTAGENFDVIDSVVSQLANDLPHFPRTVGFTVFQVPRQSDIWSHTSHCTSDASYRHVSSSNVHARADDVSIVYGIAHGDVIQCAINANIADCGESRHQKSTWIRNRFKCDLCRRLL